MIRAQTFARLVGHDVRLVWRYGIVAAVGVVTAVWLVVLLLVPDDVRVIAAYWIVLLDSGIVGLFFVGALVLFERDERTLDGLAVAPVGGVARISARVIVLLALALVASVVVTVGSGPHLAPLLAGVALLSVMATLNAIVVAAPFRTFSDYVTLAPLGLLPLSMPLILRAAGVSSAWFHLLPGYGAVDLILGARTGVHAGRFWLGVGSSLVWAVVLAAGAGWAHQRWLRSASVPSLAASLWSLAPSGWRSARLADQAFDLRPALQSSAAAARTARRGGPPGSAAATGPARLSGHAGGARWAGMPVLRMLSHDLRLLGREPMTAMLVAAPWLLTLSVGIGMAPLATALQTSGVEPGVTRGVAAGLLGVGVPALLGGAAVALLLLSDRDDATLLALRVTPLALSGYLAYRGGVAAVFGAVTAAAVLVAARVPPACLAAVPLVAAAAGITAFAVAAISRNKVEALAAVKLLSVVLFLPLASLVFAVVPSLSPPAGLTLLAIVPTWWPVQVLADGLTGAPWGFDLLAGSVWCAALAVLLWRVAMRRLVR